MNTTISHRPDWLGVLQLTASAAGFASLGLFAGSLQASGLTLSVVLAGRFGGSTLLLWIWLVLAGQTRRLPLGQALGLLAMGAFGYAAQSSLYLLSAHYIPLAMTALLLYTYPVFVALLAWAVRGERLDRIRVASLALTLLGCGLAAGFAPGIGTPLNPTGVLMALGAALVYSLYILAGSRFTANVSAQLSTAYVTGGATVSFVALAFVQGSGAQVPLSPAWGAWVGLVLVATVLPVVAFFAGLSRVGPTRAAIFSAAEPIFTLLLAALFLVQTPVPLQAVGGALIIAGMLLLQTGGVHLKPP